ncbi:Tsr2p ASCRUDRAFT_81779 [Ascoidea rubescens DSM 1968]|uniref:Pre-rRNA-processing protein TSR2 n=1 Tax=Ascoidea rubescens DSM 1968 TaxID=1344418 RepID=A0A1D2VE53_9ASCO|nr:hypothetical protein ASCRUDRAFT_81779 [Ascoidea rubescens DSM 1968]ODV59905.1 hypothetical protein ASCRUDRAFT_81779 [Ascoidea rubescens DSM 1968]
MVILKPLEVKNIDPTDYVEATTEQDSLIFADEKQQAKFELGVSMIIYSWNELDIAVENKWGGPNSEEKRDWVTAVVVDLFREKAVDNILIEDTLLYIMFDEFENQIENDSGLIITARILDIYRDCVNKEYKVVDKLYETWLKKQEERKEGKKKYKNVVINDDSSIEVEEEEEKEKETEENVMAENKSSLANKNEGPIVDDDGFELVQKKGKRRR